MKCRSLWHTPLATVRTRTSRPIGLAMSTFSIVRAWWGPWKTAAFMGVAPLRGSVLPRPALTGDEVRESVVGLGAPHDVGRVGPLVGPLLLEGAPHVLQHQRLDAHHGFAAVLRDHGGQ